MKSGMSGLIPDEANVLYHSQRNAKGRAGRPVTSGIIWREILSGIWRYRAELNPPRNQFTEGF
jgi:hypothetical protein